MFKTGQILLRRTPLPAVTHWGSTATHAVVTAKPRAFASSGVEAVPAGRRQLSSSTNPGSPLKRTLQHLNPTGVVETDLLRKGLSEDKRRVILTTRPWPLQNTAYYSLILAQNNVAKRVLIVGAGKDTPYHDPNTGLRSSFSHITETLGMLYAQHCATSPVDQFNPDVVVVDRDVALLPPAFPVGLFPAVRDIGKFNDTFPQLFQPIMDALSVAFLPTDVPVNLASIPESLDQFKDGIHPQLVAPTLELSQLPVHSFHGDIATMKLPPGELDLLLIKNTLEYVFFNLRIRHPDTYHDKKIELCARLIGSLAPGGTVILDGLAAAKIMDSLSPHFEGDALLGNNHLDTCTVTSVDSYKSAQEYQLKLLQGIATFFKDTIGVQVAIEHAFNPIMPTDLAYAITIVAPHTFSSDSKASAKPPHPPEPRPEITEIYDDMDVESKTADKSPAAAPALKDQIVALNSDSIGNQALLIPAIDLSGFDGLSSLSLPFPFQRAAYLRNIQSMNLCPKGESAPPQVLLLGIGTMDPHRKAFSECRLAEDDQRIHPYSTEAYEIAAMVKKGSGQWPNGIIIDWDDELAYEGSASTFPQQFLGFRFDNTYPLETRQFYQPVFDALNTHLRRTDIPVDTDSLREEFFGYGGIENTLVAPSEELAAVNWGTICANVAFLKLPERSFNLIQARNVLHYAVLDLKARSGSEFKAFRNQFIKTLIGSLKKDGVLQIDSMSAAAICAPDHASFMELLTIIDEHMVFNPDRGDAEKHFRALQKALSNIKTVSVTFEKLCKNIGFDVKTGHYINPFAEHDIPITITRLD